MCFPERTVSIRKTDPVWMTILLRILFKDRDSAWYNKNMSRPTCKYFRLRKEINLVIRRAKSRFLKTTASTRDAKTLWKTVKAFGRMSNCKESSLLSVDAFSEYFSSVYYKQPTQKIQRKRFHDLTYIPLVVSIYEVNELVLRMRKEFRC